MKIRLCAPGDAWLCYSTATILYYILQYPQMRNFDINGGNGVFRLSTNRKHNFYFIELRFWLNIGMNQS